MKKKLHEMNGFESFFSMLNPVGDNFNLTHLLLVVLFLLNLPVVYFATINLFSL